MKDTSAGRTVIISALRFSFNIKFILLSTHNLSWRIKYHTILNDSNNKKPIQAAKRARWPWVSRIHGASRMFRPVMEEPLVARGYRTDGRTQRREPVLSFHCVRCPIMTHSVASCVRHNTRVKAPRRNATRKSKHYTKVFLRTSSHVNIRSRENYPGPQIPRPLIYGNHGIFADGRARRSRG